MTKQNSKWRLAAIHLSQTNNKAGTARKVGVSPATIHNWLKKPEFQELVEKEEQSYLDELRGSFVNSMGPAQKK